MEAVVIGGGVAGPVAAIALRRVGWDVTVYEAYTDPAGDVGSFVSLGDNGLRALEAIGCRAAVAARGTALPLLRLYSGRGSRLGEAARGRVTLMRGHLVETLRDLAREAGATVVTGRRLVDAGGGTATFADGGTAGADLIVGADGIHSRLRTVIDPDAPVARYAGLWTVGGHSAHPVEPGAFGILFGARATMVYAPTAEGTLWAAQVPAARPPEAAPGQEALAALFAGDRGPAADLVRGTTRWHPRTLMQAMPGGVPRWHRDGMVVLGDAAHPMGAGQGANLAVEDAVVLAKCLRDEPSVGAALRRYEQLRRPRTDQMLKVAGANRDAKVAGPVAARLRDVMMPFFFKRFAQRGSAWMDDYDVAWNAVSAPASAST
ncbi:FAD-dependent monooxygenase [Dactylosporangium aurantiacum]|uniref:FAD-dependent monooxygenase n=1 Tax=Dactylosporangium aurantiacum TaxID=35754 RepID=A0A9Q9MI91_9ACTN|nr:NAD(P)/FAD-dependent oxidoreductase [Dactylosporangium aurantiacum]MDG6102248.1 NAD(P)/FAD-dependent oxidoreductase [Dactylosporangium aurantiacum]UWZ53441.1 FAD-dependent monooxygenase [Dactylosporangium aurantiacum]